ncbi:hypothetical protein TNCV_4936641 [Trichonephila clavipes]|nr:hypothetical protein TNCV_4936641 [Trichonephila clavipes]
MLPQKVAPEMSELCDTRVGIKQLMNGLLHLYLIIIFPQTNWDASLNTTFSQSVAFHTTLADCKQNRNRFGVEGTKGVVQKLVGERGEGEISSERFTAPQICSVMFMSEDFGGSQKCLNSKECSWSYSVAILDVRSAASSC